jgi:hypothetical protein
MKLVASRAGLLPWLPVIDSGRCGPLSGIPRAIIPALCEHLSFFVAADPSALVFPGPKGGPPRPSANGTLMARGRLRGIDGPDAGTSVRL